jgi:hypothetical protein
MLQLVRRFPGWSGRSRLVALVLVALLVGACGASGGSAGEDAAGLAAGAREEAAAGGQAGDQARDAEAQPDEGEAPGHEPGDEPLAQLAERRIIKTGEVTIEVESVAEALGRVRALATELGGYVGGSQAGTLEQAASLTLRIPADRFDDALARLHELGGEVVGESSREEDVTGQIVDLGARIENLRASEASYRTLLEGATRIEDVLSVQERLDAVRGEIEQLTAQLEQLEGQADLATLTVTLTPQPAPVERQTEAWNPGATLNEALAALVAAGQGLLDVAIWVFVVWVPILLLLSIVALVALRGVLEVRRRMPARVAGDPRSG